MAALDEFNLSEQSAAALLDELKKSRGGLKRHGAGKSAAVVVIDMQNFFIREDEPVGAAALAANATLLLRARAAGIPVFLVRNVVESIDQVNPCWLARVPDREVMSFLTRADPRSELHAGLEQAATDIVIEKPHASGFLGSSLDEELRVRGVDTILLTGTATSGCVRATAVDGAGRNYRVLLVEDCTFDLRPVAGAVSLYDMAERYADVISLDEAIAIIERQIA